jgi:hypothetical protein
VSLLSSIQISFVVVFWTNQLMFCVLCMQVQSRAAAEDCTASAGSEEAAGTTAALSSTSPLTMTTSLDGLRAGDVGELLPRDAVKAADLATTEFLPSLKQQA